MRIKMDMENLKPELIERDWFKGFDEEAWNIYKEYFKRFLLNNNVGNEYFLGFIEESGLENLLCFESEGTSYLLNEKTNEAMIMDTFVEDFKTMMTEQTKSLSLYFKKNNINFDDPDKEAFYNNFDINNYSEKTVNSVKYFEELVKGEIPVTRDEIRKLVKDHSVPLEFLDVSKIEDFRDLFRHCHIKNQNLSKWDISSVRDFRDMFDSAIIEDSSLNGMDFTGVKNADGWYGDIFNKTEIIRSSISNIKLLSFDFRKSKIIDSKMDNVEIKKGFSYSIFDDSEIINSSLSNWKSEKTVRISDFFYKAKIKNSVIENWELPNVSDFKNICRKASIDHDFGLNTWKLSEEGIKVDFSDDYEDSLSEVDFVFDLSNWNITSIKNEGFVNKKYLFDVKHIPSYPYGNDFFEKNPIFDKDSVLDLEAFMKQKECPVSFEKFLELRYDNDLSVEGIELIVFDRGDLEYEELLTKDIEDAEYTKMLEKLQNGQLIFNPPGDYEEGDGKYDFYICDFNNDTIQSINYSSTENQALCKIMENLQHQIVKSNLKEYFEEGLDLSESYKNVERKMDRIENGEEPATYDNIRKLLDSSKRKIGNTDLTKIKSYKNLFLNRHIIDEDLSGMKINNKLDLSRMFPSAVIENTKIKIKAEQSEELEDLFVFAKFKNCELDIDISKGCGVKSLFEGAKIINTDIKNLDLSNNKSGESIFESAISENSIVVDNMKIDEMRNVREMFSGFKSNTPVDISHLKMNKVTNVRDAFHNSDVSGDLRSLPAKTVKEHGSTNNGNIIKSNLSLKDLLLFSSKINPKDLLEAVDKEKDCELEEYVVKNIFPVEEDIKNREDKRIISLDDNNYLKLIRTEDDDDSCFEDFEELVLLRCGDNRFIVKNKDLDFNGVAEISHSEDHGYPEDYKSMYAYYKKVDLDQFLNIQKKEGALIDLIRLNKEIKSPVQEMKEKAKELKSKARKRKM